MGPYLDCREWLHGEVIQNLEVGLFPEASIFSRVFKNYKIQLQLNWLIPHVLL